jgi:hypothetical protein
MDVPLANLPTLSRQRSFLNKLKNRGFECCMAVSSFIKKEESFVHGINKKKITFVASQLLYNHLHPLLHYHHPNS